MTEVDHLSSQISGYVSHNESSLSAIGRRRLLEGLPQGNRRTNVSTSSAQTTLSNSNARIRRNIVPHTNVRRAESETVHRKSIHFNQNQENNRNMSMHHQEQSFVDELNRSLDANANVRVSRTRGHESIDDFMIRIQQEQDIRFKQTRRIMHLMQSEIDIETDMILTQDLRVANRYRQGGGAVYDDFDYPVVAGDVHHYGGARYRYSELDLRGSTESFGHSAPHPYVPQQQHYDDGTIDHSQAPVAPTTALPQQRTHESIPAKHVQSTLHDAVDGMEHSRDTRLTDVPVVHANRGDAATSKLEKQIMEKRKSRVKSLHQISEHLEQVEHETISHHVEALPDVNALHEQTRRHEQQRGSLVAGHVDAQHTDELNHVHAAPAPHYTVPLTHTPDTFVAAAFNAPSVAIPHVNDHRAAAEHNADTVLQAARAARNERMSSLHEKMAAVDSVNAHITEDLHKDAEYDVELVHHNGTAPETTAPITATEHFSGAKVSHTSPTTHAVTASEDAEKTTLAANREARKQRLAHIVEQVHAVEDAHVTKKAT